MGALPEGGFVGRFELVRVVGATALGIDYRAVDRAGGTEVVLREYLPRRLGRRVGTSIEPFSSHHADVWWRGLAAFKEESRTLMRIEHPALARVIDLVETHGTAYQVTLYRGGTSLAQLRPLRREPPSEASLRALLDEVLGALEVLHRHGIAHGALTPEQILLLTKDRPLLLGPDPARADLAPVLIAPLMTDTERAFAAPELLAPSPVRPIGPWTDLYSLAATMRYWIAGEWPAPAAAAPRAAPEPTATLIGRLRLEVRYSEQLLRALDMALATEPAARLESVAQFRRALGSRPSVSRLLARPAVPPASSLPLSLPRAPESDLHAAPILPKRELPLDVFLRAHGAPREASRPTPRARPARPARRLRTWAGGGAALLVAASCAAWQLTLQTPFEAPAQAVDAFAPARQALAAAPALFVPASPRDGCAQSTPLALAQCLQSQCAQGMGSRHAQCAPLSAPGRVD